MNFYDFTLVPSIRKADSYINHLVFIGNVTLMARSIINIRKMMIQNDRLGLFMFV